MVTTGALIHGDQEKHLAFHTQEHPVVLQLGGNDPKDLAFSAKIGEKYGYDEINLNCGCPSDRVQNGAFGACLMKSPQLVSECVKSMQDSVSIPVTVKCRIGIDDSEEYEFLEEFISIIAKNGCNTFVIHARKAWLNGLSPKENREVPPLRYDIAARIKTENPSLNIIVNGGVKTVDETKHHLQSFDGVMIGREAYQNPWLLSDLESQIFNHKTPSRTDIALQMQTYINENNYQPHSVVRHMMGLFKSQTGGRIWRQTLSEYTAEKNVIEIALDKMKSC